VKKILGMLSSVLLFSSATSATVGCGDKIHYLSEIAKDGDTYHTDKFGHGEDFDTWYSTSFWLARELDIDTKQIDASSDIIGSVPMWDYIKEGKVNLYSLFESNTGGWKIMEFQPKDNYEKVDWTIYIGN
jgi:hypothetical protein